MDLDLHYLLGRAASLKTCNSLVERIALYAIDRPEGVGIPGDQLQRLSSDFATGSAGVLLFTSHLLAARASRAPLSSFGVAPFPDFILPKPGYELARAPDRASTDASMEFATDDRHRADEQNSG